MHLSRLVLAFCLSFLSSIAVYGQSAGHPPTEPAARDSLVSKYLLPTTALRIEFGPVLISVPGFSIGSPTAFGARWRDVFAGVGFQNRIRYADARDGALTAGFGLGDPVRSVGVEVAFTVWDTATEFFDDRSLSIMLHRFLPGDIGLGVGVENLLTTSGTDSGTSGYVVVTKIFRTRDDLEAPFSALTASVGVGGGRFVSEENIRDGEANGLNVFGSLGVRVLRSIAVVADWTGQDLGIGISIAPLRHIPLIITPAFADLAGVAGDGARFVMAAGVAYKL